MQHPFERVQKSDQRYETADHQFRDPHVFFDEAQVLALRPWLGA